MRLSDERTFIRIGVLAFAQSLFFASDLTAQSEARDVEIAARRAAFVDTSDLASPNAEEVFSDVQSAHSWSRFQRGQINGFRYVMFPDGHAKIYAGQGRQILRLSIECTFAVSCVIIGPNGQRAVVPAIGAERPAFPTATEVDSVATYLAAWMLAGSGTPPIEETARLDDVAQVGFTTEATDDDNAEEPLPDPSVEAGIFETNQGASTAPTDAASSDEIADPSPSASKTSLLDEGICSEREQFIPTTCAQPTQPLMNSGPSNASNGPTSEHDDTAPEIIVAGPTALSFSERYNLQCSITSSANIEYEDPDGDIHRPGKPRISLGCGARLTDQLSLRVSFLRYVNPAQQEAWDPDFTYALSYRLNDNVTFRYTNYTGRFDSDTGGILGEFGDGSLRASFRLPKVNLPKKKSIACSASLNMLDPLNDSTTLSCGYAVTDKFRIGAAAYFYLPDRQSEFQPDFSYNAAYQINDSWLVSYSNYSNNRWPWNSSDGANSGLRGGSFALSYSITF